MKDARKFEHTAASGDSFDSTVEKLVAQIEKGGMRVLHIHDVKATLAQKGFVIEPFKMIEFCRADHAHALFSADPKVGVFLPCKISVYVRNGVTYASALDFKYVAHALGDESLSKTLLEVDAIIRGLISFSK
ncbi:MAG TPA: DUF302 domain-containing protein [Candidatus Paceibacterota bacterium]|nr:DUF302 domain-containing protein [Candidatus Paceibacterota bacterium]